MLTIIRFVKELKRVRWEKPSRNNLSLLKIIIFVAIAAAFFLTISVAFTRLWLVMGV